MKILSEDPDYCAMAYTAHMFRKHGWIMHRDGTATRPKCAKEE